MLISLLARTFLPQPGHVQRLSVDSTSVEQNLPIASSSEPDVEMSSARSRNGSYVGDLRPHSGQESCER
jgi:hypothetical protein